jgi:hypothetical protein
MTPLEETLRFYDDAADVVAATAARATVGTVDQADRTGGHSRRTRRKGRNGLGLLDIDGEVCSGLILIGRGEEPTDNDRELLQRHECRNGVEIHSYDWLVREAEQRISFRDSHPSAV